MLKRMPRFLALTGIAVLFAAEPSAPPSIEQDGVRNAYSRMPPTLAGGAIGRGSVVLIEGVRLAPPGVSDPSAVSVELEAAGGARVSAVPTAVSEDRILAVLPRDIEAGTARIRVRHSGQESLPREIAIVPASFGILAVTPLGEAPEFQAFAEAAPQHHWTSPAHPGQTLTIWGTGLGEGGEAHVFVGGKPARVRAAGGIACCAGVDRIDFEVPKTAATGCAVPVQVGAGGTYSNAAAIPVASGRTCADPAHWLLDVAGEARRTALITLIRGNLLADTKAPESAALRFDLGLASFTAQAGDGGADRAGTPPLPSLGTCTFGTAVMPLHRIIAPPLPVAGQRNVSLSPLEAAVRKLDAGNSLRVRGTTGMHELRIDPRRPRLYVGKFGGPLFSFVDRPGNLRVWGSGGADVGPFESRMRVGGDLRWTNRAAVRTLDRKAGRRLEWIPPDDHDVLVVAAGGLDTRSGVTAWCVCMAPAGARQFTLPPEVLANLPESGAEADILSGFVVLAALPGKAPRSFRAKGLDAGYGFYIALSAQAVTIR